MNVIGGEARNEAWRGQLIPHLSPHLLKLAAKPWLWRLAMRDLKTTPKAAGGWRPPSAL
jgi:hypothetical protein